MSKELKNRLTVEITKKSRQLFAYYGKYCKLIKLKGRFMRFYKA